MTLHTSSPKTEPYSLLYERFDVIVFDWDGTAVTDRTVPADELSSALETLLNLNVICAVVTGTNFDNIFQQGIHRISASARRNLFICTNRGSETFGFDDTGAPIRLYLRKATAEENAHLDTATLKFQDHARKRGLETRIVWNRLNRRKIDLIPTARWRDPKKSEFRELLHDTLERLRQAGINGGLNELMQQACQISKQTGLQDPKITSDIKHIEIGLTDKADSVRWIQQNLIKGRGISVDRMVIFGDEFGSIGGVPGSDAVLRIQKLENARFVSVGIEPEGPPSWVIMLHGGPRRFLDFLHDQIARHEDLHHKLEDQCSLEDRYSLDKDPTWRLELEGFDPSREREIETLFSIGNGYLGVRGTSSLPIPASQEDLLIAGVYDQTAFRGPISETRFLKDRNTRSPEDEIFPIPYPFRLKIWADDQEISVGRTEMDVHRRILNFKKGVYFERHDFNYDAEKKVQIEVIRWASLAEPHLIFQEIEFTSQNGPALIQTDLSMHGPEDDSEYVKPSASKVDSDSPWVEALIYDTRASSVRVHLASRIFVNGRESKKPRLRFQVETNHRIRIQKIISVFTTRDEGTSAEDLEANAQSLLSKNSPRTLPDRFHEHIAKWDDYWQIADIHFKSKPELTHAQRFNLYQMRIAIDHDPRVSIGARALTGRAYKGHVFWDTEIFMFPFFLYTEPEIARALLLYRYHTLDGARRRAKLLGQKGACYAWESTVSGHDMTPQKIKIKGGDAEVPIFNGTQQMHVTADIAHAVWKYWDATLDDQFILDYGAEILLETARFWASRVQKLKGRYHILRVVGPDEYHYNVDDNAYTNWMARLNLQKAGAALDWMKRVHPDRFYPLSYRLQLTRMEIENWKSIARFLVVPEPNGDFLIEQFSGFFRLKETLVPETQKVKTPISRLFNWREINERQIVKQADVLMIPFLFPEALSMAVQKANYQYYEPITDHGSSLSMCVHAAIASRIGFKKQAEYYWQQSLNFDLMNTMMNTELGIHPAAIGGTWQALVFHMLGINFEGGKPIPTRNPHVHIPLDASGIRLNLVYRGKLHPIKINKEGRVVT